jgi:hypothetical protein
MPGLGAAAVVTRTCLEAATNPKNMNKTPTTVSTHPKIAVAIDELLDLDRVSPRHTSAGPARRRRSYRIHERRMKIEPNASLAVHMANSRQAQKNR